MSSERRNDLEPYLNTEEAGWLLGLSTRTIQRMLTKFPGRLGSIPYYDLRLRVGNDVRHGCWASELRLWIEMGCPPAEDFRRIQGTRKGGSRR